VDFMVILWWFYGDFMVIFNLIMLKFYLFFVYFLQVFILKCLFYFILYSNFIDVTWDLVGNNIITLSIVWFTSKRKVFNLNMAHERAETCRWDKLCRNISVISTLNKLCLTVLYLYFVILYNTTGMSHLKDPVSISGSPYFQHKFRGKE
jgi:hypothetical protein